ncbi:alkene reductase [Streptomyces sp. NPDC006879]|uniref:alkene reductase n=1 Tax=Streptomyces sp. NPDC006879 TaxID=3364767 RepID=UPI00368111E2
MTSAFDPISLGGTALSSRIAMAPMTRSRVGVDGVPTSSTVEYYLQRASAGLIITEGIQPSVVGQGYPNTPGLHTLEQIAGWRRVTDAVHGAGGRIYAQVMHAGRIGHPALFEGKGEGLVPVGASGIAAAGELFTPHGMREMGVPRELSDDEIHATIEDFATAARNAVEAGFDGVELHGANGYLIHQFLAPGTNRRTDAWGGSVANRIRFAVEVTKAVAAAIGAERTALRISPGNPYNDISEPDPQPTYEALVAALAGLELGYLHVTEAGPQIREITLALRKEFAGTLVLNPATEGPTDHRALPLVEDGIADVLAFGALFLANPDLPSRLRTAGPYNVPDPATFFGGDERGYTDYPVLT